MKDRTTIEEIKREATTTEQMLSDVESFLLADGIQPATGELLIHAGDLDSAVEQIKKTMMHADDSLIQSHKSACEPPPANGSSHKYGELIDAYRAHKQLRKSVDDLIYILQTYSSEWQAEEYKEASKILSYADVFGFTLPDDLQPNTPGAPGSDAAEMTPF